MRRYFATLLVLSVLTSSPVRADGFTPVRDLPQFLKLIDGRDLHIGLYGLTLRVTQDGEIAGKALGRAITGSWRWDNGYFCRVMDWSGYAIKHNCQLVEASGEEKMRFTVDQGAGDSATFRLQ